MRAWMNTSCNLRELLPPTRAEHGTISFQRGVSQGRGVRFIGFSSHCCPMTVRYPRPSSISWFDCEATFCPSIGYQMRLFLLKSLGGESASELSPWDAMYHQSPYSTLPSHPAQVPDSEDVEVPHVIYMWAGVVRCLLIYFRSFLGNGRFGFSASESQILDLCTIDIMQKKIMFGMLKFSERPKPSFFAHGGAIS